MLVCSGEQVSEEELVCGGDVCSGGLVSAGGLLCGNRPRSVLRVVSMVSSCHGAKQLPE